MEMRITLSSRTKKSVPASRGDLHSRGICSFQIRHEHSPRRSRRQLLASTLLFTAFTTAFAADPVSIQLAHHTPREMQAAQTLKQVLSEYDLRKYIFTREVVIEQRAMNHAFPVLTLNVRFADSPDELLSSFVHEQLHWYLREHDAQQKAAIAELRQMYPNAPVGLPEGADTAYSTYGHLVDCYLEIQADRELIGAKRTTEIIKSKPWYTWIYKTILRDEDKIRGVVQEHGLEISAPVVYRIVPPFHLWLDCSSRPAKRIQHLSGTIGLSDGTIVHNLYGESTPTESTTSGLPFWLQIEETPFSQLVRLRHIELSSEAPCRTFMGRPTSN